MSVAIAVSPLPLGQRHGHLRMMKGAVKKGCLRPDQLFRGPQFDMFNCKDEPAAVLVGGDFLLSYCFCHAHPGQLLHDAAARVAAHLAPWQ